MFVSLYSWFSAPCFGGRLEVLVFGWINIKGITTLLYLPPGLLRAQGLCSVMSHGIWARHRHSRLIATGISQLALGQNLLGILLSPPAAGSDVDLGFLWSFGLVSAAVLGWGYFWRGWTGCLERFPCVLRGLTVAPGWQSCCFLWKEIFSRNRSKTHCKYEI